MRRSSLGSVLLAAVVLALAACGGGSSPATQSPASTASPTEAPSSVNVKALDYSGALFAVDDLNGIAPGAYHTADEADMAGLRLRSQCNKDTPDPGADAGSLLELQDEVPSLSATTSVHAFADQADAAAVFGTVKEIAQTCASYETQGDTFERISTPGIQPAGDDSFSLFVRKTDTGLLVADHFVLRGPFVFDFRWAIDRSAAIKGIAGVIVDEAVRKFIGWADDQL
jgi:hypothetical protein